MECNVCGKTMKTIAEGKQYIYFRCSKCHWYSTEEKEKSVDFDYEDYKTFDENLPVWNSLVEEAIRILNYKFKLIYRGGAATIKFFGYWMFRRCVCRSI